MLGRKLTNFLILFSILFPCYAQTSAGFPYDCDDFYNSSCFTYFTEPARNWHDANSDCMSRGGYLTSIHSEVENNLTAQLVTRFTNYFTNAWIGLEYTHYDQRSNWADGTPVTYTNTLGTTIGTSHCLVIYGSGRWRSFDCSNQRQYICRQHVLLFGKLDENMNYQAIANNEKLIAKDITTLICRTDTYPSPTEIIWEYTNSEETDWTTIQGNWNASTGISTVITEQGYGYYRCHVKNGGVDETYIAKIIENTAKNTDFPDFCDEFFNRNCYINFNQTHKNWYEANSDCMSRGGYLTSIHSEKENILVSKLVKMSGKRLQEAWIGLNETGYNQKSNWADTTPVNFKSELVNSGNSAKCLVIQGSETGPWISYECKSHFQYICKQQGSVFGRLHDTMEYIEIKDNEKINATNLSTLICRTDTYPNASEIIWEYRDVGTYNWTTIVGDLNASTGISTVITRSGSGFYRCHISVGGVEHINIVNVIISTELAVTATTKTTKTLASTSSKKSISTTNISNPKPGQQNTIIISIIAVIVISLIVSGSIIFIILFICYRKKKQKAYQHIDKSVYSKGQELTTIRDDKSNYENTKPIERPEIRDYEQMDPLKCENIEFSDKNYYSTGYVKIPGQTDKNSMNYEVMESTDENNFLNTYKYLKQMDHGSTETNLLIKFKELNTECTKELNISSSICTKTSTKFAMSETNRGKNPNLDALPYDKNRVILSSSIDGSDYINASYMNSFEFIATIQPFTSRLVDFLQMISQTETSLIVTLSTEEEERKFHYKNYWGKLNSTKIVPPFSVKTGNIETYMLSQVNNLTITDGREKREHFFKHIIVEEWQANEEISDLSRVLMLIEYIIKHRESHPIGPVIIHCNDGIGRTGVILTVYKAIQEIKKRGTVEIFQIIKEFRNERMNFVPNFVHLSSCFELVKEYCSESHY